ncbi:electron transfer flavoprotein subunit beta/FixA family protein [Natronobacterium texcoconense]|uniref:Electron transfer flavoprotein beta subunit n=1 Tax=Natronobacterium texcoconense TaxID=1095778 RepID=A0A1H1BUE0_NATTX|nr:electron transfer flavoprotein subunit beta/FixA family protein [Natronobacterium texcoconense]SDQ55567.1 electron transfer flavoprotein beta subunit [Natronobacterium texcoconense]
MNVLSCIKRVPNTGAKIVLTEDQQRIDTSNLGFTMSPHEECAIEEAIQLIEEHGGTAHVLTLGPDEADEQLRTGLAMQADEATLLETDGEEWSPRATADAIANAIRDLDDAFDLLLFGNESADVGNYQVGVRVARKLGLPCVTGIKSLEIEDGTAIAKREVSGGEEVYEIDLPAVVAVKEGINEPRYASMRAKMQARKQEVPSLEPDGTAGAGTFEKVRLEAPETDDSEAEVLGEGPDAVPDVIEVLEEEVEVL